MNNLTVPPPSPPRRPLTLRREDRCWSSFRGNQTTVYNIYIASIIKNLVCGVPPPPPMFRHVVLFHTFLWREWCLTDFTRKVPFVVVIPRNKVTFLSFVAVIRWPSVALQRNSAILIEIAFVTRWDTSTCEVLFVMPHNTFFTSASLTTMITWTPTISWVIVRRRVMYS